jgi:predicted transcriptional regulator
MEMLIGAVLFLGVAALVISGQARTLVKGFLGVFVKNIAETPEGAEAIYTEAISEKQEEYAKAKGVLQTVSGRLFGFQKDLENENRRIKDIEAKAETYARAKQFDKVDLYDIERQKSLTVIEQLQGAIAELEPMVEEAQFVSNCKEKELQTLMKEKTTVIEQLKLNKTMKEVYDSMDELKRTTGTSKLLGAVKDGAKTAKEQAVGARVVHENKISTKLAHADAEIGKVQGSSDWANKLKQQYGATSDKERVVAKNVLNEK